MRIFDTKALVARVSRLASRGRRPSNTLHTSPSTLRSSGFTLVELLVVMAMLMLLAGAITSSVSSAQKRAKIAQATAEAQEMTNAILAYSQFGDDYKLPIINPPGEPANEKNLSFILGAENGPNGEKIPVLYNASIKGGQILDPWGHPYHVTIKAGRPVNVEVDSSDNLKSYVAFPNFNRRPADN